jgi:cation diffusion facilitator CzcD-associated flavoprotein CzcO
VIQLKPTDRGEMPRVAIIGAGPGGIGMGAGLRQLGVGSFTIFEQSADLGGTWWDNDYPGAAVDTPLPFYSFTFNPFDFTGTYSHQPEILEYLQTTAKRFQLDSHFRFNTKVEKCVWDEPAQCYDVTTSDGQTREFDVVVSAVGLLNNPNYPTWPGLDKFKGPKFHSARWEHQHDLTGKRVAIVGTGSTGAQIVPAIAPIVDQLYVYQRQPGWLLPKGERMFTPKERAQMLTKWGRRKVYYQQWLVYEKGFRSSSAVEGTKDNVRIQKACEDYIQKIFGDRPDLAKMVTPDYPFGGKRLLQDTNFYPTLKRDNVELVPHAVTEVTEKGLIDDTNTHREIDVLIMSTGFQAANFLGTFDVIGRGGKSLHDDVWKDDPYGYLGLTVPGFPNFYMLYGPNSAGAPVMYMTEKQVGFVKANLKRMAREGVTSIEVRESVTEWFNAWLQKKLNERVSSKYQNVHNYARSVSGRNVVHWTEGMTLYALMCRFTPRLSSKARTVARAPRAPAPTPPDNRPS